MGVVHVPFAPALSYSPSGDPEFPSDSAKAAHACLLGLCGILPPSPAAFPGARSFLVCWLPLAFFFCGPCFGWSCLPASFFVVLVGAGGPSSLWVCFVLLAWPVFWFVLFVWCFLVLSVSGWFLGFAFCFCWFPPRHSEQVHSFMLLPPVQLRSWFVIVLVSVRRLDRFTCTVYLHRVTMFLLKCSCVTIC